MPCSSSALQTPKAALILQRLQSTASPLQESAWRI
jgi:hypothetical protein